MTDTKSRVYVKADTQKRIIDCDGGYTSPPDLSGWVEIDNGYGDRCNLCKSHYFPEGLFTPEGVPQYALKDDAETLPIGQRVYKRTVSDMQKDIHEVLGGKIRMKRDRLLAGTDWTQMPDCPLDDAARSAVREYRQQLRDLPQQSGFPADIRWPEMPAALRRREMAYG